MIPMIMRLGFFSGGGDDDMVMSMLVGWMHSIHLLVLLTSLVIA